MATTKKAAKQVQVVARYAHKTDGALNGIVTYAVRSSNGKDIYCTTLISGKASGCGCPAHKPCYHMTGLEKRELDRKAVAQVVAIEIVEAEPVIVEAAQPRAYYWCPNRCCYKWSGTNQVCDPQPDGKVWSEEIHEWIMPSNAKAATRAGIKDIAHRGSLNGSAQTAQMPAWLAILPSRQQVATHA